jgi:hypothetical protein
MLNESEASALRFPSFDQEVKSRFFVARLLRMTDESKARVLSHERCGPEAATEICASRETFGKLVQKENEA